MPLKRHDAPAPFAEEVVAMIGDSITATAGWWMAFRNQLMTRHPGSSFDFRNLGVPGGGVQGALERYDWDIAPNVPTSAFVMFGMNDVWREGYGHGAKKESYEGREYALKKFLNGTLSLCDRLEASGVRVILLTPTPYDEFQPGEESLNFRGVNQALAVCAGIVRGVAAARGVRCVDFHARLTELCQEGVRIISPDRVHPNPDGEAVMANILFEEFALEPRFPVPSEIEEASRQLFEEEYRLRILACVRAKAWSTTGLITPESVKIWINENQESVSNPWLSDKMKQCLEWLDHEAEFNRQVALLRKKLASANHVAQP